jgi:4-hydroxymandelate oxidase
MVVSTQASVSLEDVAAHAGAPLWFQLYIQPDRGFTADLVARAEAAGYRALVVTVDAPVNGLRNREQRAGFSLPEGVAAVNLDGIRPLPAAPPEALLFGTPLLESAAAWPDLDWLRGLTRLPILVKGITDPDDARRAIAAGMDGIIVSNHGGRSLDGLPATIDLLPGVVAAVAGAVPVLVDGGIRRGGDVLRALALGAKAVLVGRPYVYALAAAGAPGVAHVIRILRAELELGMALTGCRDIAAIDGDVLARSA